MYSVDYGPKCSTLDSELIHTQCDDSGHYPSPKPVSADCEQAAVCFIVIMIRLFCDALKKYLFFLIDFKASREEEAELEPSRDSTKEHGHQTDEEMRADEFWTCVVTAFLWHDGCKETSVLSLGAFVHVLLISFHMFVFLSYISRETPDSVWILQYVYF